AAEPCADRAITGESRTRLSGGVGAAIVRRQHLEILDSGTSIAVVVLDTNIWKLHVIVAHRQMIREGPFRNFSRVAVRTTITISTAAVGLLEKPLIRTLQ